MNNASDLAAADTLTWSQVSYKIDLPLGQGSQSGSASDFCLSKPAGKLAFTLTSDQLGLPITVPISFVGTETDDGSGVIWQVDSGSINVSYMGYNITRIHGTLATTLSSVAPQVGTACDASETRLFEVMLQSAGAQKTIDVEIDVLGGQTAHASLAFFAGVGEPVPNTFFSVAIVTDRSQTDGCGGKYQLYTPPHSMLQLTALVENVQSKGTIKTTSYEWKLTGPAHQISQSGPSLQISLDGPGNVVARVSVSVLTDLDSAGKSVGQSSLAIVSEADLALLRSFCRLRQLYRFIPQRTPIGDRH